MISGRKNSPGKARGLQVLKVQPAMRHCLTVPESVEERPGETFYQLEEPHQIFNCFAAADKLYAAILADKNFCRTRAAVVS